MRRAIMDTFSEVESGVIKIITKTKKPNASRMGKGKGEMDHIRCQLEPHRYVFKFKNMRRSDAVLLTRLFRIRTNKNVWMVEY